MKVVALIFLFSITGFSNSSFFKPKLQKGPRLSRKQLTDSQEKNLKIAVHAFKNDSSYKNASLAIVKNRKQNPKLNGTSFYGIDPAKFKQAARVASLNEAKLVSEIQNGII